MSATRENVNQGMPSIRLRSLLHAALAAAMMCSASLSAQVHANREGHAVDVAVTYAAEHTLKAATTQSFWLQGGSAEAGMSLFHGLGAAVNVTGTHTGSIGSGGVPLSLLTFTAGPRYRVAVGRKVSVYGEGLFGVANGFGSQFPKAGQLNPDSSATSFAMQLGGGFDYRLSHRFAVRALDLSYVRTQLPNGTNDVQNILQVGAGVVLRFGGGR